MFPEQYTASDKITNKIPKDYTNQMPLEGREKCIYFGIQQFFAPSSCLKSVIDSPYQKIGYCCFPKVV